MTRPALLNASGLSRIYGPHRGVSDIDLRLHEGEILGLLGANGAGKSTILRMLAGTLAPSAGRVSVAGHDMADAPRRAKRHLGYLPERPPVYPELTVDEYLGFAARLHGLGGRDRRRAVGRAKDDTGLADVGRRLIGALSKGYAQRVGIAQAIIHRPDLLILDEPTAGLDPYQLRGVRDLVATLATRHAVIVSSHILSEIQAMATRVMMLAGGRIVLDTPLEELAPGSHWIELGVQRDPSVERLAGLPGVIEAVPVAPGRWRIRTDADDEAACRAMLAETAVTDGWGLHTLVRRERTLEDRFIEATQQPADTSVPRP